MTFADDEALMAKSALNLQRMISMLDASAKSMGLKLNVKFIVFKRSSEKTVCNIILNGEEMEQIDHLVYLGSLFAADGKVDREIYRRINDGSKVISNVGRITKTENVTNK